MAAQPPVQPGHLSPDGGWRWDGQRWVPAAMVAPPRRSKAWIWWLAGAVTVSLVLLLVGAGYGIYQVANKFQSAGFSCLPADFPAYPVATVLSESTVLNGPGMHPGDSRSCIMVLQSKDDVATVMAFYKDTLTTGDWYETAVIDSAGQVQFHRVSRPATLGFVQVLRRGQYTVIQIQLNS